MVIWHQMCEVNHACPVRFWYNLSEICTIQMSHGFISWCIDLILVHDIYIYWTQGVYFVIVLYSLYYSEDVCLLHMKYTMKLVHLWPVWWRKVISGSVKLVILLRDLWSEIGDFHGNHDTGNCLVGCDTVWSCRNLSEFQRNLLPPSFEDGSSWMSVSF